MEGDGGGVTGGKAAKRVTTFGAHVLAFVSVKALDILARDNSVSTFVGGDNSGNVCRP